MSEKAAYSYCIRLLSIRDYSRYKLTKKLQDRGYTDEEIDFVINKLIDQRYLREEEYQRIRVKQLLVKGYSNSYIIQKCQLEEIYPDNDFINELRDDQNLTQKEIINQLIEKKLRNKQIPDSFHEKQKIKLKLSNFLRTKGFNPSESLPIIEHYLN